MANGLRTISIRFVGDTKGLYSATRTGGRQLDGFKKKADGLKTALAGGFLGGFAANVIGQGLGAVKNFFGESISGWRDHQKIMAQTAQVVKSTGGAAAVSARHVGALSDKLEAQTGVDGDLIQNGANLLLTFTNIRNGVGKNNKIFDSATKTVTDMSVALGQSTKTSAIQLGKALNDPVKGVTALQKVGVSFTASQKKQIATLVKHGKTQKAQKIILRELNKEFGGSAKAQMSATDRLMVAFHALQDSVGKALVPVIDKLAKFMTDKVVPALTKFTDWAGKNPGKLKAIAIVIGVVLVAAFVAWAVAAASAAVATIAATLPILAIVAGVALLIAGIILLVKHWGTVWGFIKGVAKSIAHWFTGPFVGFFKAVWDKIKHGLSAVKNFFVSRWHAIINWIKGVPGRVWGFLKNLWDREKRGMQVIRDFFISKWRQVLAFIGGIPDKVRAFFARAKTWLLNAGKNLIAGLRSGVSSAISGIKTWLKAHVWNPIVNAVKSLFGIHSPSTVFAGFGKNMILGLIKGMIQTNPLRLVKKALGGISGGVAGLWAKLFGGQGGGNAANMALGKKMAATLYGWSGGQWDALRALWTGESGWNNNAQNPTSSAYGIAQFLNSTWGSVGAHKTSDPAGQIAAGLKYIRQSYGTPANAYSKWLHRSPHWYEKGTAFVPETGPAVLHKGEMVLPADIAEAVRQGAGGGDVYVTVILDGEVVDAKIKASQLGRDRTVKQRSLARSGANR